MAEAKQDSTILDNVIEYGVPSSALIYGLTRPEQDDLIRDQIYKKIISSLFYKGRSDKDIHNLHLSLSKLKRDLEDGVQRLPEEMQDSWLLSLLDGGDIDVVRNDDNVAGSYHPTSGDVVVDEKNGQNASTIIHEYDHKANHDMMLADPRYESKNRWNVPDAFLASNIYKDVQDDYSNEVAKKLNLNANNNVYSIDLSPENTSDNFLNTAQRVAEKKGMSHNEAYYLNERLADLASLDPNIVVNSNVGHGEKYKKDQEKYALAIGLGNDESYGAAQSVETPAILADVISHNNKNYNELLSVFPKTMNTMMEVYRNDPRKKMIKEFGFDYGQKAYGKSHLLPEKERPVPYDPNKYGTSKDIYGNIKENYGFIRIPGPYGYRYMPRYYSIGDAMIKANKMGSDRIEIQRAKDGWIPYYGDGVEISNRKLNRKNFDDTFNYYVDTPEGRRGFRSSPDLSGYLANNKEVNSYYRKLPMRYDNGSVIVDNNGNVVYYWEPQYEGDSRMPVSKYVGMAESFPEKVKKYESDRKLIEKIRKEKALLNSFKKSLKSVR